MFPNIYAGYEIAKLKAKLNYGADLVKKVDKTLRDTDLTNEKEVEKIRAFCFDLAGFLREG